MYFHFLKGFFKNLAL